jgi:amidase
MSPAWKIDTVNGDQIASAGAGDLAAVACYPHLTVTMGLAHELPVGLSFIGPAWSEAKLLSNGYAYEQASHARVPPWLLLSIEADPAIAPLLAPLKSTGAGTK